MGSSSNYEPSRVQSLFASRLIPVQSLLLYRGYCVLPRRQCQPRSQKTLGYSIGSLISSFWLFLNLDIFDIYFFRCHRNLTRSEGLRSLRCSSGAVTCRRRTCSGWYCPSRPQSLTQTITTYMQMMHPCSRIRKNSILSFYCTVNKDRGSL